jgi:6-phosphogluconolactonase (cycloisomerase 2 family)
MSSKKAALYAGVGPTLIHYDIDVENCALVRRSSLTMPNKVEYAWPHASKPFVYMACSGKVSRNELGTDHFLCALKVDSIIGAPSVHGAPVRLPHRPLHVTTDVDSRHVLVAFNDPSGCEVYRIAADGTLGARVPQRTGLDFGIFAHQVRVTPNNRAVILVTRGNPGEKAYTAFRGRQKDPGALKVFDYRDGVLGREVSIAPGDGYEFGPRHLDFHPTGPWVYVSLETQNELQVYKRDGGTLSREPVFRKPLLGDPSNPGRQGAGTVHVHPNGRIVYGANRGHMAQPYEGRNVVIGADNTLVVHAIDPATGEPKAIQHIESRGMCPRTFALDPGARVLVAGNSESHWVKEDGVVKWMPANLSLFKVLDDGTLEFRNQYDLELAPNTKLIWSGIIAY